MAIARVSGQFGTDANYNSSTGAFTSATPTLPVAATAGNMLLAGITPDKSAGTFTVPSGWTALVNVVGASTSLLVIYKVAAGGETSVTATWSTSQLGYSSFITEYAGFHATTPWGPITTPAYSDTARTSMAIDPAAATAAGKAIAIFSIDSVGTTNPLTSNAGFRPAATGWTWVETAYTTASFATPGTALVERDTAVTNGEDIASTTFSWTTNDQVIGSVLLANEATVATPTLTSRTLGIPSATSVPIAVRTTVATSVRAQVSTSSTFASGIISGSAGTPNAQGDTQLTVPGLTAGTAYYTRIGMTVSGVETFSAISSKSFRTAPSGQTSFSFSFGSCTNATDSASMTAIAARNDDFFLHLGDLFYADGSGTTLANIRTKITDKIQATNHAAVFSGTPSSYIPSDHDGTVNGSNAGNQATAWTNWNAAVREVWPYLDLPGTTGVYRSWTWGRVTFIQIDRRSFATAPSATDNSSKTSLGATQKQWLKDTITAAPAGMPVVIVNPDPWIGSAVASDDGWFGYTTERTELANFFAASGRTIIMLAGDMHAVGADDGTNAPGGITVFHGAPLNNAASQKGGPYSAGIYPASGTAVVQQYGRCVVTDSGTSIAFAFTGYSSDNTSRITLTKTATVASSLDKLKVGSTQVAALKVGSLNVDRAYVGSTQVWP